MEHPSLRYTLIDSSEAGLFVLTGAKFGLWRFGVILFLGSGSEFTHCAVDRVKAYGRLFQLRDVIV